MTFEERYKSLNLSQKRAVDAIEGPVMVIAGPGTGKTTILTMRIANILKRTDTPAHGILAITYTSAGVRAMRENLRTIIGSRADEVAIHTFHDFASAMIAEYQDHFLHLKDMRLISDVEQESLVRTILLDPAFAALRPAGRPDTFVEGILRAIDNAKRDALTPDMVVAYAKSEIERIEHDEVSRSTRGASKGKLKAEALEAIGKCERTLLFAKVYAEYEKRKSAEHMMDFNDLIMEFLLALKHDELFLRLIQERFLYVHVDEHQDTNDAQNLIIGMIAEFFDVPNIFIVGDEKQAIYRFQGASVENFMLLQKRYPAMQIISLDTNYRSHQGILDTSFSMIEHNYAEGEHTDLRIPLASGKKEAAAPIVIAMGENTAAADAYLVEELKRLRTREPASTIAIITRRNRELERVLRLLESNGIPVSSERSIDIFKHPLGVVFFDLIEYLADPARTDALGKTMAAGLWHLTLAETAELSRLLRSGKDANLETRLSGLSNILKQKAADDPLGFLITACRESGFADIASRDPAYVYVWRGIMTLAESLVRDRGLKSPITLMEALLEYRRSAESKMIKVSVGAPDFPIRAMTAHGSKGLEFDYVFLPYATEEAWVSRPRGAYFVLPKKQVSHDDIRDTRRLFYVALTRARTGLTILTAREESDGSALTPLRFLDELGSKHISHARLPRLETVLPALEMQDAKKKSANALTDLAKHVLLSSGLSPTALNHFLESPLVFLQESILKLPQAPSVSAEKGRAMHFALESAWRLAEKTPATLAATIQEKTAEYLDESFLPSREKEIVRQELAENAVAVAHALIGHFNTAGLARSEYMLESIFEGSYEGMPVRIPIRGKLDLIIDNGNVISIFDYKTRQGMSVAEIKGETKSSNGDYFRQLVFYALLAGNESRWKMKRKEVSLVFVSPDTKGRCPVITLDIREKDMEKLRAEIQSLIDCVWGGSLPESLF